MKTLRQAMLASVAAGVCLAICAGQEQAPAGTGGQTVEERNIVQGKVVQDPGGQGIRKVKVSLSGGLGKRSEQYEAVTDEAGNFRFEDVEPGRYFLQFERSGYSASRQANRSRIIEVIAGKDTKDLLFHMVMAGVITGKIVDLEGDPLQGISVTATVSTGRARRGNMDRPGNASTNDLGEYRIADLAPEKYVVQASPAENQAALPGQNGKAATRDRLVYVTTYFPGTLDAGQAIAVEVPAGGGAVANFGMQTSRVYRVAGTVVGLNPPPKPQTQPQGGGTFMVAGGQGIGQILLMGKDGQQRQQNVGEDGTFEFSNVPPGTYRAVFMSFSIVNGQMPSVKMQTFRTAIEVNGSDVLGLQFQVEPGGSVSGRLRMEGNEKIDWKQLNVGLVPTTEEGLLGMGTMTPTAVTMLDEDGSFQFKEVQAGECQLAVGAGSERFRDYYTKSVLLGGREVVDTGFTVSPGTMLDVVISAKGAGIEGTVVDAEGKPAAGAQVGAVPSSGKRTRPDAYQLGRTDERGHFELRGMNPGEFLVVAFEELQEDYRSPEFVKKYEGKGQKVELEEGAKKRVDLKLIAIEGQGG